MTLGNMRANGVGSLAAWYLGAAKVYVDLTYRKEIALPPW